MLEPKKPEDPVEGGEGLQSGTQQKTQQDGGQKGSTDSTETKQQK